MALVLGLDVGTTSVKAVILDEDGAIRAAEAVAYPTQFPAHSWAEQNPEEWWAASKLAIAKALAAASANGRDIAAVGVSSHAPCALPVDKDGRALHPALIWMDQRATSQADRLRDIFPDSELLAWVGNWANPYFALPKFLWLKENKPDIFTDAAQFLQVNGYLIHRLTGAASIDPTSASLTLLYNQKTGEWENGLADAAGFPLEKLPPLCECQAPVGTLTATAAGETGLRPGVPVVAGANDAATAALAASILEPGDAFDMSGESTGVGVCLDQPTPANKMVLMRHVLPGRWLIKGSMSTTGGALRWFLEELASGEALEAERLGKDPFALLSELAARAAPGAGGIFLPYMMGERAPVWDSDARGIFFGLSLKTRRQEMVRAIFEGTAFGLRHNIEVLRDAGIDVTALLALGGGNRSRTWVQIKADVTGCPLRVAAGSEGSPVGAAVLAGMAAGLWRDIRQPLGSLTAVRWTARPDPGNWQVYDRLYRVYRELYPRLHDLFPALPV